MRKYYYSTNLNEFDLSLLTPNSVIIKQITE